MFKKKLLLLKLIFAVLLCGAQKSVLFEAGATYFTNNMDDPSGRLSDFAGFTVNTRIIMSKWNNSSISVEIPLSLRSRIRKDILTRFGMHLPIWVIYNYGAGASGISSHKRMGLFAGAGYGYFYQKTESTNEEPEPYKESLSTHGPHLIAGLRFPLKNMVLFKVRDQDVHPSINIRFIHLFHLRHADKSIGAISLTAGFVF